MPLHPSSTPQHNSKKRSRKTQIASINSIDQGAADIDMYRRSVSSTPDEIDGFNSSSSNGVGSFNSLATPGLGLFSPTNNSSSAKYSMGSFGKLMQTPTMTSLAYTAGITPVPGGLPFGLGVNTPMSDISMNMSPSIFSPTQQEFVSFCQSSALKQLQSPPVPPTSPTPFRSSSTSTAGTGEMTSPSALEMLATASSAQKSVPSSPLTGTRVRPRSSSSLTASAISMADCEIENGSTENAKGMNVTVDPFSKISPIVSNSRSPDSVVSASSTPSQDENDINTRKRKAERIESETPTFQADIMSPASSIVFASPSNSTILNNAIDFDGAEDYTQKKKNMTGLLNLNISAISTASGQSSPDNSSCDDIEVSLDISAMNEQADNENIQDEISISSDSGSVDNSHIQASALNSSFDTSVGASPKVYTRSRRLSNNTNDQCNQESVQKRYETRSSKNCYVEAKVPAKDKQNNHTHESSAMHALLSLKMDSTVH